MSKMKLCDLVLLGVALLLSGCTEKDPVRLAKEPVTNDLLGPDGTAAADDVGFTSIFRADLSDEDAGVDTRAKGVVTFEFNKEGTELRFKIALTHIENVTVARIVYLTSEAVWLYNVDSADRCADHVDGLLAEGTINDDDLVGVLEGRKVADLRAYMAEGATSVDVLTVEYPSGEIRGQIIPPRGHKKTPGPVTFLYNRHVGTFAGQSIPEPGDVLAFDVPQDVPIWFRFSADASSYGGAATSYRYGWDVQNLQDKKQWEVRFTPFVGAVAGLPTAECPPRQWRSGYHVFTVEVRDDSKGVTRMQIAVNVVPFTMRRPLLIVDDCKESSPGFVPTNGGVPSDAEHDAFWNEMAADVAGFVPEIDVIEASDGFPLAALADYKSVIWVGFAAYNAQPPSFIYEVIRFRDPRMPLPPGPVIPNILALFMEAGGRVLLCGEEIMTASINRDLVTPVFPFIFRYELGGDQDGDYEDSDVGVRGIGDNSFAYEDCGLNVLDIAYISNRLSIRRPGVHGCPVTTIRPAPQSGRDHGLRVALPAAGTYDFPELALRPEVASPGKWFAEDRTGLNSDIYNPPYFESVCAAYTEYGSRPYFESIYGNGCLNQGSPIYNAPVAFWTSTYADRVPEVGGVSARSAVWGFSPVYFSPGQVKLAMDIVLFDEWNLSRGVRVSRSTERDPSR